jgi:hypothetical protein
MPFTRRTFLTQSSLLAAATTLLPHKVFAQTGAPARAPDTYAQAKPMISGPFQPTWESLRDNYLYAFGLKYPVAEARIRSLSTGVAKVERVTLLGPAPTPLKFHQTPDALVVAMPPASASSQPYGLRIKGVHSLGAM